MKRFEGMTKEELQVFIKLAVQTMVDNTQIIGSTPIYNVREDIINQLSNYSRN